MKISESEQSQPSSQSQAVCATPFFVHNQPQQKKKYKAPPPPLSPAVML